MLQPIHSFARSSQTELPLSDFEQRLELVEASTAIACVNEHPGMASAAMADNAYTQASHMTVELEARARRAQEDLLKVPDYVRAKYLQGLREKIEQERESLRVLKERNQASGGTMDANVKNAALWLDWRIRYAEWAETGELPKEVQDEAKMHSKRILESLAQLKSLGDRLDIASSRSNACGNMARGGNWKLAPPAPDRSEARWSTQAEL